MLDGPRGLGKEFGQKEPQEFNIGYLAWIWGLEGHHAILAKSVWWPEFGKTQHGGLREILRVQQYSFSTHVSLLGSSHTFGKSVW